jgi:hypothetical protein
MLWQQQRYSLCCLRGMATQESQPTLKPAKEGGGEGLYIYCSSMLLPPFLDITVSILKKPFPKVEP